MRNGVTADQIVAFLETHDVRLPCGDLLSPGRFRQLGLAFGASKGFEEVQYLLATALQSDNALISVSAIGALGELGDDRAVPLLLPHINHEDWQVRHRLAQALGNFSHNAEIATALQTLAQDDSEIVAETAKRIQTES